MFYKYAACALAATALTASVASAQMDLSVLKPLDDAKILDVNGDRIGEIEDVLIDEAGNVKAYVVETEGFLGLGDEDVVVTPDQLTYSNGSFVTEMTEDEIKSLPVWDD